MIGIESLNGQVGIEEGTQVMIEERMDAAVAATMRLAQRTIIGGQARQVTLAWREPDGSFVLNTRDPGLGRDVSPIRLDRQTLINGFMIELERQRAVDVGVSRWQVPDQYKVICRFSEYRFDLGSDRGLSLVHVFNTRVGDGIIADEYIIRKNQRK